MSMLSLQCTKCGTETTGRLQGGKHHCRTCKRSTNHRVLDKKAVHAKAPVRPGVGICDSVEVLA
jgi:ribosomal protein L44E